jgi:hypothetical protein
MIMEMVNGRKIAGREKKGRKADMDCKTLRR